MVLLHGVEVIELGHASGDRNCPPILFWPLGSSTFTQNCCTATTSSSQLAQKSPIVNGTDRSSRARSAVMNQTTGPPYYAVQSLVIASPTIYWSKKLMASFLVQQFDLADETDLRLTDDSGSPHSLSQILGLSEATRLVQAIVLE